MPRGGAREGAGRKATGHKPNKTIRMTEDEKADVVELLELRRSRPEDYAKIKAFIATLNASNTP